MTRKESLGGPPKGHPHCLWLSKLPRTPADPYTSSLELCQPLFVVFCSQPGLQLLHAHCNSHEVGTQTRSKSPKPPPFLSAVWKYSLSQERPENPESENVTVLCARIVGFQTFNHFSEEKVHYQEGASSADSWVEVLVFRPSGCSLGPGCPFCFNLTVV